MLLLEQLCWQHVQVFPRQRGIQSHHVNLRVAKPWIMYAGVQVSLEDAEVLMATARRTSITGQTVCAPYKVLIQLVS